MKNREQAGAAKVAYLWAAFSGGHIMKLQTKLLTVLLAGLLAVYLGSCMVQRHFALASVDRFSQTSKAAELDRQWQWVGCVGQAITTSLENVMATGDMDLFAKILREQAALSGLQEASLTDFRGHVAYTTVPARVHGELPAELKPQVLTQTELVRRQTPGSFEIYKPLVAQKDCVTCHTERRQGDVIGVLSLRFSDEALKRAESSWDQFGTDFSRANALATAITTVVLISILAGLVIWCVHSFMSVPLEQTAGDIAENAQRVRRAAEQFTGSSLSLAQGSNELAASIAQTSAALAQLTSTTATNAGHANSAREIARLTHTAAENSVRQMEVLKTTITQIDASSNDIGKINKLIHEIAFQTNLLALNASVEAARAGETGMGFAVVAEEVRNLAQRSAAAAKETAAKVEGAIGYTAKGVEIGREVAAALNEIVVKAGEVEKLAGEVAGASREQSAGITQINSAIAQMDRVTKDNASTAGQTATAAGDLDAQAETMRRSVGVLVQLVRGAGKTPSASEDDLVVQTPDMTAANPAPRHNGVAHVER